MRGGRVLNKRRKALNLEESHALPHQFESTVTGSGLVSVTKTRFCINSNGT